MRITKIKILLAGFLLALPFLVSIPYAAESPDIAPAPVAVIPDDAFEFPPAVEGETITHEFLIQNRGTADLTILEVKTT